MCKGIVLFLISFGIVNNCYALTFTGVKDSVENFTPNIATINDIQKQPSNVAIVPDTPVILNINAEKNIEPIEMDFAELQKQEIKTENKTEKIPEKTIVKNTKKNVTKNISDPFGDLKVDDGKEILVSMSIPQNYKINSNKVIKKSEKTVAKNYKKRRKNSKKRQNQNTVTKITEPVIYDKQIVLADSIKSKTGPIFPILNKSFEKTKQDVDTVKPEPTVPTLKEEKTVFSNFDSSEIPNSLTSLIDLEGQKNIKKHKDVAYINYGNNVKNNPFVKAFSALKPEKVDNNKILDSVPTQRQKREQVVAFIPSSVLKNDLKRTYLSDNKYLSPVESVDENDEDVDTESQNEDKEELESVKETVSTITETNNPVSEIKEENKNTQDIDVKKVKEQLKNLKREQNITGSLKVSGREVLHMKIEFDKNSSALSTESVNLLRSFAQIVVDKPTNSIEISIPESVMNSLDKKKLTARRLAIVANVLRNAGIAEKQINPVLSNRDENSFAFRIISNDKIIQHKVGGVKDIMGDETNSKIYDLMKW